MNTTRRRFCRRLAGFTLGASVSGLARADAPEARTEIVFSEPHMGCLWTLRFPGAEESAVKEAARAVFAEIERLNNIFSDYLPESELNRLSRTSGSGQEFPVSPELWDILSFSLRLAGETEGLFDISLGPCVRLWRRARRAGKLPRERDLARARAASGWRKVRLDEASRSVCLTEPGMWLDLGGIAKGWVADACLRLLREKFGVEHALIDGTGQVTASAPPPGREHWRVALQVPRGTEEAEGSGSSAGLPRGVKLKAGSVATAGDYFQSVQIDGVNYSHIIDPATGLGMTAPAQASVVAPNGLLADALDTALCLMGGDKAVKWLRERYPEVEACVTERDASGKPVVRVTEGFRNLEITL